MTRKHFKAIAATLRRELQYADDTSSEIAIEDTAKALCSIFAEFNPNFDRGRFLAACGVEA
jgi:hypothetical protein